MTDESSFSAYVARVRSFPTLTREEEGILAREWVKKHTRSAADRLVRANLRYVVAIALKYRHYGVPVAELVAEGNFGLAHALEKFDPTRGTRFVTYAAYWIRAYVLNYVIRSWSLVGSGAGALRSKNFFKLRRERVRLENQLGSTDAARTELASRLGIPEDQVTAMLQRLDARDVSLDQPAFDDSVTALVDTIASPGTGQDEGIAATESRDAVGAAVKEALQLLDERERFIIQKRHMADPEDELSLAEIGRRLGVSRERARQLEARAKAKLRTGLGHLVES